MNGWVLVTGAGRRIGRAIALDLAMRGFDIIVHYHRSADEAKLLAEEIQDMGRQSCLAEIDLGNTKHVENLIPSLAEGLGLIDVLVNNAALFEPDETDPDGARHWSINADAPRLLSKAFRDHMGKHGKGVIVNLLDASPPAQNFTHYKRSKDFLADITRNMAKSFAPHLRVNGVAPGYVLPSPRQSEEDFQKLSGGAIVTPAQVAIAVRQLIETPNETGKIVTVVRNTQ